MRLEESFDRPTGPTQERLHRSYAVLSTYPPTPCGVATFSASLCEGLAASGAGVGVVRIGSSDGRARVRVLAEIDQDEPRPSPRAVDALNGADVVIVQHEYGLYGGDDGAAVIGVIEALERPSIVVAHTVLQEPTENQRAVLQAVTDAADAVVVMTHAGERRLQEGFGVDPAKIVVIPHGARATSSRPPIEAPTHHRLLTWGLLGPGKGIEWAIEAVALLDDVRPHVEYCIAGVTHPKVVAAEGEAYREMLTRRVVSAGVEGRVHFEESYFDNSTLADMIARSSVVVLPYDSPDQVTSGVLVDAVAAGRPVVSTAFPHAVELLASGAGLVVPQRDPEALAFALRRVLTEPGLAGWMAAEAHRIAPAVAWRAVAARYAALGESLVDRQRILST